MKIDICPHCGQEFSYYPSQYKNGVKKFCSRECQKAASRIVTTCPECGKEFWYHTCWPRKYCSNKCSAANNAIANLGKYAGEPPVNVVCDNCGKPFQKRANQYKSTTHHFCSQRCFGAWLSENNNGERHPNYKGGYDPYYGPNWRIQRRKARKRDNYICQRCGKTEEELGRQLDVHHKTPFREYGIERYREANHLDNLLSLCNVCHLLVENGHR